MKTVVLVTCTSDKHKGRHAAGDIYTKSSNFRKYMELARLLTDSENIFVISALHGLLSLDTVIDWYDYTLMSKPKDVKDAWGMRVAEQIKSRFNVAETMFIVIAGADYFIPLIPHLPNMEVPLKGVSMGYRPAKVDELIKQAKNPSGASTCYKLHKLFNSMPLFRWDAISKVGFNSGIYIVFEVGETFYGMDRIVRVGTHRSDGRLLGRLKDHFYTENNDGSIFRKNIGRAILNKNKHPYLSVWTKSSSRTDVNFNFSIQEGIEKQVTRYMRNSFSFICIPVETNAERTRLEAGIIATLNKAADFVASPNWRGQYSSEREIVQSGMWLKEGLDDIPLSDIEYARIEYLCNATPYMSIVPQQIAASKQKQENRFKPTYTRKYAPLTEYLSKINSNEITLSLSEIEKIIGDRLPPSAYKHEIWWANNDETHPHRLGWINEGFEVANGSQIKTTHRVVFTKAKESQV